MRGNTGFAQVNGTRLYYEQAGSGQALALIHGFSLDTRMWDDQFEVFAQQYRVIRYDLRGFGRSDAPTREPYRHEVDLRALLTHLDIEQAALIGLSLGGQVAIDFTLTYSEAVRALIPVDALFSGARWSDEWTARTNRVWEIAREQNIDAAKQSWIDHPLFLPASEQPGTAALLRQMVADYSGWHFTHRNPVAPLSPPAAERFADITAPTLVVVGERDLPDFQRMADQMQQQIPGARRLVLANAGHLANMEDPIRFNSAVLEFLAGAAQAVQKE